MVYTNSDFRLKDLTVFLNCKFAKRLRDLMFVQIMICSKKDVNNYGKLISFFQYCNFCVLTGKKLAATINKEVFLSNAALLIIDKNTKI